MSIEQYPRSNVERRKGRIPKPAGNLFGIVCIALASSAFLQPQDGSATPRIACKEADYSFGTVTEDSKTVEHVFTIANEGDATLQIGNIRGCCGATVSMATNFIAPGSNTALKVVLSLQGRNGDLRKSIYVSSNDPKQPYFQVRLLGKVVPGLAVYPRSLDFGRVETGAADKRDVVITCAGDVFRVTNALSSSRSFSAAHNTTLQTNSHQITIGTVPPMAPGVTKGSVLVLTDSAKYPKVEIPVVASVLSDLVVVPQELLLVQGTGKVGTVTRYLAVRSRAGMSFKVLKVEVPDPSVEIALTPMGTNGWQCQIGKLLPFAELNGMNVIIWTDHPEVKQITVPIRVSPAGN